MAQEVGETSWEAGVAAAPTLPPGILCVVPDLWRTRDVASEAGGYLCSVTNLGAPWPAV